MTSQNIEHEGIIKTIHNKKIVISIISQSACSACHANGLCNLNETKEKEIEVYNNVENFTEGEKVIVYFSKMLGSRAVFLGYILPFLLLIFSLLLVYTITKKEELSGLISIVTLIIYYIILYLSKNKISKTFKFSIKKINY